MKKTNTNPDCTSVEEIAEIFAALGQVSRLQIVRLLLSAYPQGLPAGEIQKELEIPASTLSHHLDKLRQVGLVSMEKDKQWIWYSVRAESVQSAAPAIKWWHRRKSGVLAKAWYSFFWFFSYYFDICRNMRRIT
jgi:DNA-binding transcriptional ArsR family regulator